MQDAKKNNGSKIGTLLMIMGLLFVLGAAGLVVYNIYSDKAAAGKSDEVVNVLNEIIDVREDGSMSPAVSEEGQMAGFQIEGDAYVGVLSMPTIDRVLPVMSELTYPLLKKAPCRDQGSVYDNNIVIAAHNYSSHFGTIKYLKIGDELSITDVYGQVFNYTVIGQEIRDKYEYDKILSKEETDWDLTLFTCTPGGLQRVVVRCARVV